MGVKKVENPFPLKSSIDVLNSDTNGRNKGEYSINKNQGEAKVIQLKEILVIRNRK